MHPILAEIPGPWGTLPVYAYGGCLGIGLLLSWLSVSRRAAQSRLLDEAERASFFLRALVGALVIAWVFSQTMRLIPTAGHYVSALGATCGGLLGVLLGLRIDAESHHFWRRLDLLAIAFPVMVFMTQLGAYLEGSSYGLPLSEASPDWLQSLGTYPLAMPLQSEAHLGYPAALTDAIRAGTLPADATRSLPLHPAQLYLGAWSLGSAGVLLWVRPRVHHAGAEGMLSLGLLLLGYLVLAPLYEGGGHPGGYLLLFVALILGLAGERARRKCRDPRPSQTLAS